MISQHVGTGSFNSTFRFNAKEFDDETGNYYYGARYYEPGSRLLTLVVYNSYRFRFWACPSGCALFDTNHYLFGYYSR